MTENKLGVDWEKELPEEVFDYLRRCNLNVTEFQKEVLRKMIVNGLIQNNKKSDPEEEAMV